MDAEVLNGYLYSVVYDNAGNIKRKSVSFYDSWQGFYVAGDSGSFVYESSEWGDRLASTNGIASTYDDSGNPLTYFSAYYYFDSSMAYTFTWEGKQLATANYNGKNASYTYNDEGIRTSKTVNGVTTTYHLNGSQIVAEETDTYIIVYLYDAAGSPIGMQYREFTYDTGVWDTYFFEKNMFGDIVAVYGKDGTKYLSYSYDAWGSVSSSASNGGANTGAAKNPFRYRGYYYDSETNFYYLNSRYYDPVFGRFISPDSYISTGQGLLGYNMYAYCNNNPIMYVDCSGYYATAVIYANNASLYDNRLGGNKSFFAVAVAVGGTVTLAQLFGWLLNAKAESENPTEDPPQSITQPDDGEEPTIHEKEKNKDSRLKGKPGEIKKEGNKETHIGPDGRADKERHWSNHGNPKRHTNPHDHDISWNESGKPSFGKPKNYWDGSISVFP